MCAYIVSAHSSKPLNRVRNSVDSNVTHVQHAARVWEHGKYVIVAVFSRRILGQWRRSSPLCFPFILNGLKVEHVGFRRRSVGSQQCIADCSAGGPRPGPCLTTEHVDSEARRDQQQERELSTSHGDCRNLLRRVILFTYSGPFNVVSSRYELEAKRLQASPTEASVLQPLIQSLWTSHCPYFPENILQFLIDI